MRRRWRAVLVLSLLCASAGAFAQDFASSRSVLRESGASAVVLDAASGRVLLSAGDIDAEAAPGSTVKPFVLRAALQAGVVNARTTAHCDGTLRIAGRNLACVHPRDVTVLDARQALAESCNTYFATVARRLSADQLETGLRSSGLQVSHVGADVDARELTGLGLLNVRASVRTLAAAYRALAQYMADANANARVVREGLIASVESGAAHAAQVPGVRIAGKTGTVDVRAGRSHGWFAGVVYGAHGEAERVIVVYSANGNGRDAAAAAKRVLEAMR